MTTTQDHREGDVPRLESHRRRPGHPGKSIVEVGGGAGSVDIGDVDSSHRRVEKGRDAERASRQDDGLETVASSEGAVVEPEKARKGDGREVLAVGKSASADVDDGGTGNGRQRRAVGKGAVADDDGAREGHGREALAKRKGKLVDVRDGWKRDRLEALAIGEGARADDRRGWERDRPQGRASPKGPSLNPLRALEVDGNQIRAMSEGAISNPRRRRQRYRGQLGEVVKGTGARGRRRRKPRSCEDVVSGAVLVADIDGQPVIVDDVDDGLDRLASELGPSTVDQDVNGGGHVLVAVDEQHKAPTADGKVAPADGGEEFQASAEDVATRQASKVCLVAEKCAEDVGATDAITDDGAQGLTDHRQVQDRLDGLCSCTNDHHGASHQALCVGRWAP
mmetsp:Transcript_8913/g.22551  ORF Transcript_8913/g.22551 Transcript_8913/m.22551 type:complete len:394 (+) Transcript_8913:147-1328(+)